MGKLLASRVRTGGSVISCDRPNVRRSHSSLLFALLILSFEVVSKLVLFMTSIMLGIQRGFSPLFMNVLIIL